MKRSKFHWIPIVFAAILPVIQGNMFRTQRVKRQDGSNIDAIFNIPITAIKQSAIAAQSFSPEQSQNIDNIFKIPVATLEAVGNLVKNVPRRDPEEVQRLRAERRQRMLAYRESQRMERENRNREHFERIQNDRLNRRKDQRYPRDSDKDDNFHSVDQTEVDADTASNRHFHHKDPFGLNALADLLVGHHGFFGGVHFGHYGGVSNILAGHRPVRPVYQKPKPQKPLKPLRPLKPLKPHKPLQFGHGSQGTSGAQTSSGYEVHEVIDEDVYPAPTLSNLFGGQTFVNIQNKIAPKNGLSNDNGGYQSSDDISDDLPIENKIAPRSRLVFRDNR